MKRSVRTTLLAGAASLAVVGSAWAQVFQATGFATVSMAGLGNTLTVSGESRLPILPRDASFSSTQALLHVRATGHRGVVRQLEIDIRGARSGERYGL